ncbi:hypothetical protein [Paraburkholderia caffeinilytica]|uniref:hypothetical protein n=1 Tax=Paraburkholderia caffeinilytica TaxID=1761016 RepID=UPI0038BC8993
MTLALNVRLDKSGYLIMNRTNLTPLFHLGRIVATPGALDVLQRAGVFPFQLLVGHQCGDGGVLCAEDRAANAGAIVAGGRILSVYEVGAEKIYVITEADRASTTVLLASEY